MSRVDVAQLRRVEFGGKIKNMHVSVRGYRTQLRSKTWNIEGIIDSL